jgi:hypothetical protein
MAALAGALAPGATPAIEWCVAAEVAVEREPTPRILLPVDLDRGVGARFELGRALAALAEPALAGALVAGARPGEGAEPAVLVLDRAGLVAAGDVAGVLERVGPRSPRGRALAGFVASRTATALLAALGVGLIRPLPNVDLRA